MLKLFNLILITLLLFGNITIAEESSLSELLIEKASSSNLPAEKKQIMLNAIDELSVSQIKEKAIKVSDKISDFSLSNHKGEKISLYDYLKKGSVVLTFYRGGWCPYCNIQLHFYQKNLAQFKKYNANLIAISPETPDNSLNTIKKNELEFEVVSDINNEYAKKLGLVFSLNKDLTELYKSFGINLEENQNNKNWELPLSATFVIDKEGIVQYSFIDVDYKKRADVSEIVKALKSLK